MRIRLARCHSCLWGFLLVLPIVPVSAGWKELAPMPTPRSMTAAAHWDDTIYVPGGLGGLRSFEAYHVPTDTWRRLTPLPSGRHHLMCAAHAGKIYVFGGADEQWRATRTAWVYDPETERWRTLTPMPEPRYAAVAVSLGAYIYAVGGDGPTGRLLRYDPAQGSWALLAPPAQRRDHTGVAAQGGLIYLIGGRLRDLGDLRSVEIYDVKRNRWTPGPRLRNRRGGVTALVLNDIVYALGGEVVAHPRRLLDTSEVLDLGGARWRDGPELPVPLQSAASIAVQGSLYLIGGSDRIIGVRNHGRVFRYNPNALNGR